MLINLWKLFINSISMFLSPFLKNLPLKQIQTLTDSFFPFFIEVAVLFFFWFWFVCDHPSQFLPDFWNLVIPRFLMKLKYYIRILLTSYYNCLPLSLNLLSTLRGKTDLISNASMSPELRWAVLWFWGSIQKFLQTSNSVASRRCRSSWKLLSLRWWSGSLLLLCYHQEGQN